MKNSKLYINSTIAFVTAFLLTTLIHEGGHFIAYLILNANPTMYHNYVQVTDQTLSNQIRIIAALAGPVISLIQGIVLFIWLKEKMKNNDYNLLGLWLCLFGFINFFGYLMLTPLSTEGDTGKVAQLLSIPFVYKTLISVFGLAAVIFVVQKTGRWFARFIPDNTEISIRRKYINMLVLFPILTGSVINSVLAFPLPSILSIIYPATSSYVILSSYGRILKTRYGTSGPSILENKISQRLVIFLLAMLFLRFIFSTGIKFS